MHGLLSVAGNPAPLGIAVAKDPVGPGYKVFVCQSPDILVFTDKEGKGKADGPPTKLLTGFNGFDHDHGVHGILIGPDRKLYFSIGDPGVHNLQSPDGKGRKSSSNNTDVTGRHDLALRTRRHQAGTARRQLPQRVRAVRGQLRDHYRLGQRRRRPAADAHLLRHARRQRRLSRRPQDQPLERGQPGIVPKILRTYSGAPTGICFYEGTLLPKQIGASRCTPTPARAKSAVIT